jgi:hypothetical protein
MGTQVSDTVVPLLRLKGSAPSSEGAPAPRTSEIDEASVAGRRLVCVRCGHAIARQEDALAVGGALTHTRVNPIGVTFHFGSFARAEGCHVDGVPVPQATWFPGCAWQLAWCSKCRLHLGWYFTGAMTFFALVLDRLADGAEG